MLRVRSEHPAQPRRWSILVGLCAVPSTGTAVVSTVERRANPSPRFIDKDSLRNGTAGRRQPLVGIQFSFLRCCCSRSQLRANIASGRYFLYNTNFLVKIQWLTGKRNAQAIRGFSPWWKMVVTQTFFHSIYTLNGYLDIKDLEWIPLVLVENRHNCWYHHIVL